MSDRNDIKTRFTAIGDQPMGKPVSVSLPMDVDQYVRSLPDRSEWLRRVICETARREMKKGGKVKGK